MDIEITINGAVIAVLCVNERPKRFVATQYPYSYAYDLLLEFNSLIPQDVLNRLDFFINGRSCMSAAVGIWARDLGVEKVELAMALGNAYLERHGLEVDPEELFAAGERAVERVRLMNDKRNRMINQEEG